MGETANALGIPLTFDHGGKTYTFSPLTFEMMGIFERWLEKRAMDNVARLKPEDAEAANLVMRDIVAGVYSWHGKACMTAIGHTAVGGGGRYYLFLRLKKAMPEIDMDVVNSFPVSKVVELMNLSQTLDFDPNAVPPASPGASP